jgi:hypothetical protein
MWWSFARKVIKMYVRVMGRWNADYPQVGIAFQTVK